MKRFIAVALLGLFAVQANAWVIRGPITHPVIIINRVAPPSGPITKPVIIIDRR